jgi:small subunit ribosomal protein S1
MSLGVKQLSEDPWSIIDKKYSKDSRHSVKIRNFTNFGIFVELEEGVDGLIHISDLSWSKKIKHPSEFTSLGENIEVVVLDIDGDNRRLSLGHKQLEENPWDVFETLFTLGSIHSSTIINVLEKGSIVSLPYGVEAFAPAKHLVKIDGSTAKLDETIDVKVIEFNKDSKKIIVSHSKIHEDDAAGIDGTIVVEKKSSPKKTTRKVVTKKIEKTTLGDMDVLSALKADLESKEKGK